jgi:NAD(P)-dependent dehydrogenase (short-subunit alcohol dehydrogenase family)
VESIRPELAAFGIEATAIHPGDFKTEISAKASYPAAAQPGSPHFEAFERAGEFYRKAEAAAPSPQILARRIDRLLERRRLPVRIVVGTPLEQLGVWAKSQLPSRLFEIIRAKAYGP